MFVICFFDEFENIILVLCVFIFIYEMGLVLLQFVMDI